MVGKRLLVLPLLLTTLLCWARDAQPAWIQVNSPHFTVVCEGSVKQAQRIAEQFERMRMVFKATFPKLQIDPGAPVVVVAVKDGKSFRALEPEAYLAKGQLELAGYFLPTGDKNYVLLRLDAAGDHPYATIYHEYTHLITSKAEFLPLWLNEGLAEFYQNTQVSDKEVILGQASEDDILWLRQNRLMPLTTLFAVDHNSPYYHEETKGSIFYSEAWALTHYLEVKSAKENRNYVPDYMQLVASQVDPVTAASKAFGDLKQLQTALQNYITQSSFDAFKLNKPIVVDETAFKVQPVPAAQVDAYRADFLAYNGREKDARLLLNQVLQEDPNNTLAQEAMGYLAYRSGRLDEAQDWYGKAVKLDSQSFLANYYFATIAMRGTGTGEDAQIEASLQKAIKLNPLFAGSYDQLGSFYGMRRKNLEQAHMLNLQAIQLDPTNLNFRLNAASVLLSAEREEDALASLQGALKLAKTPQETETVQHEIERVQLYVADKKQYQQESEKYKEQAQAHDEIANKAGGDGPVPALQRRTESKANPPDVQMHMPAPEAPLSGPHRTAEGTIKNVRCSYPAVMDVDFAANGKTVPLHTANYYKIQFSAIGYTPKGELKPCSDLEGMHARVDYIESASTKTNGMVAIELHK